MERTPHFKRPLNVFLCHTSEDKAVVRDLYHRLRSDGFEPWLDEENLLPGQEWQQEIPTVVRDSDVVIVCLSKHSVTKKGYVQKEIRLALDIADEQPQGSIFIIPTRLDNCDVPERLRRWTWVDMFGNRGYRQLKKALLRVSEQKGITSFTSTHSPHLKPEPKPKHSDDNYFPPGIFMASTKKKRNLYRGRYGDQLKMLPDTALSTNIFAPAREWLEMYSGEPISLVRNPAEYTNGRLSNWTGVTTIGADAFKIENGLLDPNILRRRLKRAALLFDRIAIYDLVPSIAVIDDDDLVNELRWLWENDIICQPEVDDKENFGLSKEYLSIQKIATRDFADNTIAIADTVHTMTTERTDSAKTAFFRVVGESLDRMMWWQIRNVALWFNEVYGIHIVPILEDPPAQVLRPRPEFSKALISILESGVWDKDESDVIMKPKMMGDVIQIILKSLPLPSDETAWPDLLSYRSDPESRHLLLGLRNWSNDIARLNLPPNELADKLEWLIEQYKKHVSLHKMKFQAGTAELILTTTADAIEELAHFRFGKLAKMFFGLRRNKVELLEAEMKAPGHEVAYILKTGQTLDSRSDTE